MCSIQILADWFQLDISLILLEVNYMTHTVIFFSAAQKSEEVG